MSFPHLSHGVCAAPTLMTERLVLRPMRLSDWDGYAAIMTGPRAVHMGGPFGLNVAWCCFCTDMQSWAVTGSGGLTVETRAGEVVGQVVLNDIPAFPEPELGWVLHEGCEGHGYATEAARAFRDWIAATLAPHALVSYVSADNDASRAVARRLGAVEDPDADRPSRGDVVYRHLPLGAAA